MIVTNNVKPIKSKHNYFKTLLNSPKLPLLDKPCSDCAITYGFYTPIADQLLEEDEQLHNDVLGSWFCHNHCNKACRGVRNYINSMRKKHGTT